MDKSHTRNIRKITGLSLTLESGTQLDDIEIAYETYGVLNRNKSNVIVVCHALSLNQYVCDDSATGVKGWWPLVVGKGRPIDTDRYFVICQNVIGGCSGSLGPMSKREDGTFWGLNFPVITIGDMVRAQNLVLDQLGIKDIFCVIGGSMGGMQALQWASAHGRHVFAAIPIASSARHSAQNIAFHEVGRQAIMADPNWHDGNYYGDSDNLDMTSHGDDNEIRGDDSNNVSPKGPHKGLAVARMAAHVTYLSEAALHRKFGRNLQDRHAVSYGFDADFQIESYLRHQGGAFVERFDANSYLYITRAMDYFDLAAEYGGNLADAFAGSQTRFCIISFTSDWLFPTSESIMLMRALHASGCNVSFVEISSDKGHDAFLLDEPEMLGTLSGFLSAVARVRGLR